MDYCNKPLIALFTYNTVKVGGPTKSMRVIKDSFLNHKYNFKEISINQKLGIIPRFKLIYKIVKDLNKMKPDIIHISGLQLHGFYATLASRISKYGKIILVVRGSSSENIKFNPIKKFIICKLLEPLTIRMSNCVYSVSKNMAKHNYKLINAKNYIGVIHNSAPNIDNVKKYSIRKELNLREDDFLCVYTGRIVYDKGLTFMLEAMKYINEDKIKLILIGDGESYNEYYLEYEKLILNKRIFFIGKRDNVLSILKDCDVYIFPSLHENLSNSLLEAGALGMPIISTNVGGNSEIIDNKKNGLLINPASSNEIFDNIMRLYKDFQLRNKLAKNIKIRILDKFSQKKLLSKLDKVYESMLWKTLLIINGGNLWVKTNLLQVDMLFL